MILKRLEAENFKQYGQLTLEMKEGLVAIIGKNGAGKSTIFEVVLLSLFGQSSGDKRFYKSSWCTPKDPVKLHLEFEIQGQHYTVVREFRGKDGTHYAKLFDHNTALIATGAGPVTAEVSKLLGYDKEAFRRSIFSSQKELGIISGTKGEERRRMVRKMIGLDKLDSIQKMIREDGRNKKEQIKGKQELLLDNETLKTKKADLKQLKANYKNSLKEAGLLAKAFAEKQNIYAEAKNAYEVQHKNSATFLKLEQKLTKYNTEVTKLQEQVKVLEQDKNKLLTLQENLLKQEAAIKNYLKEKEQLILLENEKNKFNKRNLFAEKREGIKRQIAEKTAQQAQLQKEIAPGATFQKQHEDITTSIKKVQEEIDKIEAEENKLQGQEGGIKSQIATRQKSIATIESLGKEAQCPTCLQPLVDYYDATLEKLNNEIDAYQQQELSGIQQKLQTLLRQEKEANNKLKQLQQEDKKVVGQLSVINSKTLQLQQLEKSMQTQQAEQQKTEQAIAALGTINFDQQAHQQLSKKLQDSEPAYLEYERQLRETKRLAAINKDLTENCNRIDKGKEFINKVNQDILTLAFSQAQFEALNIRKNQLEQEKDQAREKVQLQKESITKAGNEISKTEKALQDHEKLQQHIQEAEKEHVELEELDKIFKAFKTLILSRVGPTISARASELFQQITKGRYEGIRVDENFEFFILENGQYYPISRFSGGEIDLANFCLRIGISKAIAELSGNDNALSFLGFDEIFGSQDETRRFEILHALDMLKEEYRQIYIISHIDAIKEHFPNILEITKTSEGSMTKWIA